MALLPPVDWSEFARQADLIAVRDDVAVLFFAIIGSMIGFGGIIIAAVKL